MGEFKQCQVRAKKGEIRGKEAVRQRTASSAARCANIGGLRTAVSSLEIGGSLYNDVNGDEPGEEGGEGSLCE